MTEKTRKRHSAAFKAKVAEAAIRERHSTAELSQQYRVHPTQISHWKRLGLDALLEAFKSPATAGRRRADQEAALLAKIGALHVRIDELEGRQPGIGG